MMILQNDSKISEMQIKVFNLPIYSESEEETKINKFLVSHRILQVTKAYSSENGGSWAVFVEYMEGDQTEVTSSRRASKDYSKELSSDEYERYSRFREIRKRISTEKNIPPYLIFTNEELAVMSKFEILTKEMLNGIKEIPARRIKDYGEYFISDGKACRESDDSDMPF